MGTARAMAAEAQKLKGQVKGYLGQLSRNLDQLKGSVELAKATRSDHDIKRMEEYQKRAEGSLDKVESLTMEINVLEPATGAETETAADKIFEKWQNFTRPPSRNFSLQGRWWLPPPLSTLCNLTAPPVLSDPGRSGQKIMTR